MRVPLAWLREYCDPPLSTAAVADRLAMTGTEVERIEPSGVGSTERFVVGKVTSSERHPDADRLSVCTVDDGSGEPRTIVCGAPNVATGQTVALALPGARMPDGTRLGEAKLRGVRSSGMILAEDEVGIGPDHAGIMVLPDDLHAGAPLHQALTIADEVLELEITPNRPDCLGVYGVARELHAATGSPLAADPCAADAEPRGEDRARDHAQVEIEDPDLCPRFTARVFEDVRIGPSPPWLRQRLSAAGQRPISNVVDITNYVMLLTGQPLHAFDLDRVRGRRVVVRRAREGERLATLDGEERSLDHEMVVICDAEGPTSLAGIMGGQVSEVSGDTTRVMMEAATWIGPNILRTSNRLGLRSEASARFEKQLHPSQAIAAQRLVARLMVELCGARRVPRTLDLYPGAVAPRVLRIRVDRITALLGQEIPARRVRAILESLGFGVSPARGGFGVLDVTVPGFRDADVQREIDLVEEVARVHGFEKLPITLPARRRAVGQLTRDQRLRRRLEDAARDRGLHEVVAWSFTAPEVLERLRLGELPLLRLTNALSADASVMRPLLLPGLLDAARTAAAHGRPAVGLFESAHVYRLAGSLEEKGPGQRRDLPTRERHHLGVLLTEAVPATWRRPAAAADFFAAKGVLEGVLEGVGVRLRVEPGERPFLHPGRAATVYAGDGPELGWLGELHPSVAGAWDLDGAAGFEIDVELLAEQAPRAVAFRDVTTVPAVLQDIAVVVNEDVAAASVEAAVRAGGGETLGAVGVFDVYRGDQVGEGRKSLALRLEFRAADRTLTDEEVAEIRVRIERHLEEIGGRLRA